MGVCSSKPNNIHRTRIRPAIIYIQRPIIEEIEPVTITYSSDSNRSAISCNFIYDENNDINLVTMIAAVLSILISSFKEEYDICILCTDKISTIKTKRCNHNILCSGCYFTFCNNKILKCPICRVDIDINDPFKID